MSMNDLIEGMALKDHGQAAAAEAALPWFDKGVRWIASKPPYTSFTSDDLVEALGLPTEDVGTNKNNAVGALFSYAVKQDLINRRGYRPSTRKSNHAAVVSVWIRSSKKVAKKP